MKDDASYHVENIIQKNDSLNNVTLFFIVKKKNIMNMLIKFNNETDIANINNYFSIMTIIYCISHDWFQHLYDLPEIKKFLFDKSSKKIH